jgi:hypothetical protein
MSTVGSREVTFSYALHINLFTEIMDINKKQQFFPQRINTNNVSVILIEG